MKSVLGIIIAFDNDNDLRELTEHRTVAAVQWGGRYRIVDFMLSNMVNSGIYRVGILMKDKYQSLIVLSRQYKLTYLFRFRHLLLLP